MISFESDYNNGAHPKVLEHLMETNGKQSLTYGADEWSDAAKEKIRRACAAPDARIYFLSGGTQTNMTVIDGMLAHHEAVISAETGHINVHEAGAVEFTGHKVIALPAHEGKMKAAELADYMDWFVHDESTEHLAQPGMVYITFPTEYGTIYSAAEINDIYSVCRQYSLKLFIDGARMGYGLAAEGADVDLPFIAAHCNAFYIGGTKVGALCGEAVVFPTAADEPRHFFTIVKQHGALMAKGRLIGLQFDTLFTDGLYLEISRHAIAMAARMKQLFAQRGYRFSINSPTNQQFVILPNDKVRQLEQRVQFTHWAPCGKDAFECRFVTSWATTSKDIDTLAQLLDELR
jgi:threonine aldolase